MSIPQELVPMIQMLKAMPEQQRQLTLQMAGSNKEILEEGSTYEKDTTGYIDPSIIKAALYLATQVAEESPKYMDNAILSERASRVNAWKTKLEKTTGRVNYWKIKLEKTTGKKYLTKLGYNDKPEKEGLFTSLLRKSKVDEKAAEEYKEMRDALLETAKSGIRSDLTVTKAENLIKHTEEKVGASLNPKIEAVPMYPSASEIA